MTSWNCSVAEGPSGSRRVPHAAHRSPPSSPWSAPPRGALGTPVLGVSGRGSVRPREPAPASSPGAAGPGQPVEVRTRGPDVWAVVWEVLSLKSFAFDLLQEELCLPVHPPLPTEWSWGDWERPGVFVSAALPPRALNHPRDRGPRALAVQLAPRPACLPPGQGSGPACSRRELWTRNRRPGLSEHSLSRPGLSPVEGRVSEAPQGRPRLPRASRGGRMMGE